MGAHIQVCKKGRRMAAIQKVRKESPKSGKGAFIEGHRFGFISRILPGFNRSIPVMVGIQESKTKTGGASLVEQMVGQAGKVVEMMGKPVVLLLEAYFFSKTTLMTAARYMGRNGQTLLWGSTRAKPFAAAYGDPEKRKGRKHVYGRKALLKTVFEKNRKDFIKTKFALYGKSRMVHYRWVDLIHRRTGQAVRFVLTRIGNHQFMLMSSSWALDGETNIRLYAQRFKIEGLFGALKNRLGGFAYDYWIYSHEKRKKGIVPVLPGDKKMLYEVEMRKKSMILPWSELHDFGRTCVKEKWGYGEAEESLEELPLDMGKKTGSIRVFSPLFAGIGSFAGIP